MHIEIIIDFDPCVDIAYEIGHLGTGRFQHFFY